ncbi:MAG: divalent-cation tolerance protein CutA [Maricaulaceae bacterium]
MALLYTTWPDMRAAQAAARTLVEDALAACCNIFPAGTSIYVWRDEIAQDTEHVMLVKTSDANVAECRDRLLSLHPYETPCVLALRIDPNASSPAFLSWIESVGDAGAEM